MAGNGGDEGELFRRVGDHDFKTRNHRRGNFYYYDHTTHQIAPDYQPGRWIASADVPVSYGERPLLGTTINNAGPEALSYSAWSKIVRAISVRTDERHKYSVPITFTPGCLGEMFETAQGGHRPGSGGTVPSYSYRVKDIAEQLEYHQRKWWTQPATISNAIFMYLDDGKWQEAVKDMSEAAYDYINALPSFSVWRQEFKMGDNVCLILVPEQCHGKLSIALAVTPRENVYHVYTANEGELESYCNMLYDYRSIIFLRGYSADSLDCIRHLASRACLHHVL